MLTKVNVEKMPFYRLGMEKGMIEAMQADIVEILVLRFEHVPEECRARIAAETDQQRLHALLRRAVKIDDAAQLFQASDV